MRILVGNHIDSSLHQRKDMRSWVQRIFWFAEAGDMIILPAPPDRPFLAYVTDKIGIDPQSLTILVPPGDDHLLNSNRLTSSAFVAQVAAELRHAPEVSEVFALWPSVGVALLAEALGVSKQLPGAGFIAQGGGELANNKANFRALAAAAGVPIAAGSVCHSSDEAHDAITRLLGHAGAVVVKQAHNGAGGGNQIVAVDPAIATGHAGAKHIHFLGAGSTAVGDYLQQRWDWASAGGRFPVVVEEFIEEAVTVFSEHYLGDDETYPTESGSLGFVNRWLSSQTVPLRSIPPAARDRLIRFGTNLAETYRAAGYRGYISADAVIDRHGRLVFTEVNARVSGTTHLYAGVGDKVVDVRKEPQRTIVDYHWPKDWADVGFDEFIQACEQLGCTYDPRTRIGVIVTTPFDEIRGLSFTISYDNADTQASIHNRLTRRFTCTRPQ